MMSSYNYWKKNAQFIVKLGSLDASEALLVVVEIKLNAI